MGGALTEIGLPIALGIIMFGLGLDLTLADFRRVQQHPKAVVVALGCQLLLLPAICFGLVLLFDLPPLLAIGLMLLAASPGGTTANLFSHLFRGDVALNITLTAINSVIALYYYANIARTMWMDEPPEGVTTPIEIPNALRSALTLTVIATVAFGVMPQLVAGLTDFNECPELAQTETVVLAGEEYPFDRPLSLVSDDNLEAACGSGAEDGTAAATPAED